jgi:UDP-GlcNAc:undecaprenyl-phosphate GlcNAc-1-phosphate transferase
MNLVSLELLQQYQDLIIIVIASFFVSLILTPVTGVIAHKIGAIDAPPDQRDRSDDTRFRRIHKTVMPSLGGVALIVALVVGLFLGYRLGFFQGITDQQIFHIALGLAIILMLGVRDSISDVNPKTQILLQIVAAVIITLSGIKINFIEILGINIPFDQLNWTLQMGQINLYIAPIADLITILWIVGLINAMNWVSGIDGLGAGMSGFASLTIMFISFKYGNIFSSALAAALFGAVSGFFPFNFPPAKTYNGTTGDMTQGFILAVLAMLSGAKLTASLILLAIPIIDAAWVLIGRYRRHKNELKSITDLLKVSDKTHLHHRFLALGLSIRQTLLIELSIFTVFCITAYYFAGFERETILVLVAGLLCLIIFTVISFLQKRRPQGATTQETFGPGKIRRSNLAGSTSSSKKPKVETQTPEEKYAY